MPGKQFLCKQGVRQGDLLSPLIFVLEADLLQSMLNEAMANHLIESPLQHQSCPDFPVIQYADDTLLVLPAAPHTTTSHKELAAALCSLHCTKSELLQIHSVIHQHSREHDAHFIQPAGLSNWTMAYQILGLTFMLFKTQSSGFLTNA